MKREAGKGSVGPISTTRLPLMSSVVWFVMEIRVDVRSTARYNICLIMSRSKRANSTTTTGSSPCPTEPLVSVYELLNGLSRRVTWVTSKVSTLTVSEKESIRNSLVRSSSKAVSRGCTKSWRTSRAICVSLKKIGWTWLPTISLTVADVRLIKVSSLVVPRSVKRLMLLRSSSESMITIRGSFIVAGTLSFVSV